MKLLAIDGNSILNRAYYGIKALTTKNGEFTNGIYGFLNIFLRLLDEVQPDAVACAFDLRAPTFRHQMYDGYKAQRKGMPEELASQLEPLKELLRALGYQIVTCEGYEADDILGTFAQSCSQRGDCCVIATGDRDSLQLVGESVQVRLATTKMGQASATVYDIAAVQEKYGVTPGQLVDIKALMGDASDNIPGVPGIGEKTACGLIQAFGSLDGVYANLDSPQIKAGVRKKLEEGKASAYMSLDLARICCQAPVDADPAHYLRGPVDEAGAARLFARLEMFSMMNRWGIDPAAAAGAVDQPAGTEERPADALQAVFGAEALMDAVGAAGQADLLAEYGPDGIPVRLAAVTPERVAFAPGAALAGLLGGETKLRVWSSKPLYKYLYANGMQTGDIRFDGELAAYLLSPASTGYLPENLAAQYGVQPQGIEGEIPEGYHALAGQAALISGLLDRLAAEIVEKEQEKLLFEVEMPLAQVLAVMECEGFAVDAQGLTEYGRELDGRIAELQEGIYLYAGETFNINSPRQLGEVLFGKLQLPAGKKTKTGYSTNADVLDALRGKHPIIDLILEYRKLAKLKSTYVDGLLKVIGPDGRIHSTFFQTETRTGRISSAEPNLQNIPVRTKEGSRMRAFFTARAGWKLVDADYSQIELRVLAHIANDPNMIAAFKNGEDIHTKTAAQVMNLPELMVTPQMRSRAKAVNFGIVYGIGAFSLSKDIGVSVAEADAYIKSYLATYSGVREYMEETVRRAKEDGYVKTLFNRRRYLPELAAANRNTRAFGERVAMNTPIQGTAADIIKIAMVRVFQRLQKEKLRARLILQVHDELLVEAPEEEADLAAIILREEMEHAISLRVPLVADTNVGYTWLEAK